MPGPNKHTPDHHMTWSLNRISSENVFHVPFDTVGVLIIECMKGRQFRQQ
jgi:hypothetical protein